MINNSDRARLCTNNKLSRCERLRSLSNVSSVMPMIPFIGVLYKGKRPFHAGVRTHRISCDILAKNSDFDLFANSAASLAAVFF